MDGNVNGNSAVDQSHLQAGQSLIDQILHALDVVYASQSTNNHRKLATIFLDECKTHPEAPSRGYFLASDQSKSAPVRLYGLSILEHQIRYQWSKLGQDPSVVSRDWVISLAQNVSENEPSYFRNKVAQLWVEVAERCWAAEWLDMDEQLCRLWQSAYSQQEVVLHILETLSDEIFSKEGSAAAFRSTELGKACVEVFTPEVILREVYPLRDSAADLRCGTEGWLERLLSLLRQCLENGIQNQPMVRACCLKILATIRSITPWMILKAISATGCIETVCRALNVEDVALQMASVEVLHALYHRPHFQDEYIADLVSPLLSPNGVAMLQQLYNSAQVEPENLDEGKYSLLKKIAEILCALGTFLDQRPKLILQTARLPELLLFLGKVFANPSLVVSVPVAYLWTKLLACPDVFYSDALSPLIGNLLETCNHRLLRYEALPSDCEDETYLFLNEDFDTIPERHAFIGNYRRYCMEIIERIVGKSPFEAVPHILGQANSVMQNTLNQAPSPNETFANDSLVLLRLDAQFTVVMSALKAYMRLSRTEDAKDLMWRKQHSSMQANIEQWCIELLEQNTMDPILRKRSLQLVVEIATTTQPSTSTLCLVICKTIFLRSYSSFSGSALYEEAVKDFLALCPKELQKLAMRYSDQFLGVYQSLESSTSELCASSVIDRRTQSEYKAFLFTILLRASPASDEEYTARIVRLSEMINPTLDLWQSSDFEQFTSSFPTFCQLLGLNEYPDYFLSCKAYSLEDWSSFPLDERGLQLRDRIQNQSDNLPLQSTRCFLAVSTDKISYNSRQYDIVRACWHDKIPTILPKLLKLVSHAHAFNNPQTWADYPGEMQSIAKRTLVDRVWQSGISSESRDDFFNRVKRSKRTLEGLASTVRASVRGVRELSYWILHCLSYFGDSFYGHNDLPKPFAQALFADAHHLSTHQFSALLKLSQALIDGCPTPLQSQFLAPTLICLFQQLSTKIVTEWKLIEERSRATTNEEELDREMKAESVLRQLTYSAVSLASHLLTPDPSLKTTSIAQVSRQGTPGTTSGAKSENMDMNTTGAKDKISPAHNLLSTILSTPEILEPIVLFCTHTLTTHDSRSCSIITRVLRRLIPKFQSSSAVEGNETSAASNRKLSDEFGQSDSSASKVREFFSQEVLKACIEALHDPYFSDQQIQKDLAALIAAIIALYSPSTSTPRAVILSLPSMTEERVDQHFRQICQQNNGERQQRAWVLALLENVRGVSVSESGKMYRSESNMSGLTASSARSNIKRPKRSAFQNYQTARMADKEVVSGQGADDGNDDALGALTDLFG